MHIFLNFLLKFVTLDDFSAREPTNVYIQCILHLKVIKYGKNLGENKEKDKRLNVGIPLLGLLSFLCFLPQIFAIFDDF